MPDALVVPLPVGARMLVVAELLLSRDAPEPSRAAAAGVARAVHSWSGPGAVVVAGDLFDAQGPEDVAPALAGYPGLQRALVDFASGPGRRVVLLPGEHDKWLASQSGAQAVAASLQAEVASAVTAEFCTAGGRKLVQIEALSPLPSSGLTAPLANVLAGSSRVGEDGAGPRPGYSRLSEVVPGVWRGTTSAWLAGMDELDDRDALSRFVASRLVYRQFGRRAWLLAIPLLAALPAALLRSARDVFRVFLATVAVVGGLELILVAALALTLLRQLWLAFSARASAPRDLNEPSRARARQLAEEGFAGLVTAGNGRAELAPAGRGFYANPGGCREVVREYPARFMGANLPSTFLASRAVGWVELEAGHELHVRLLYGEALVPGATVAERWLSHPRASEPAVAAPAGPEPTVGPLPVLVASFPRGDAWPRPLPFPDPQQGTRRLASVVVAAAGLLSLLSAVAGHVARHLQAFSQLFPLAVPQAAGALAALGGVALIMLALGIRRGQRRAFIVCEATLVAVAAAHVLRGASVLTAVLALLVAAFLWSRRQFFRAASDLPPARRGAALLAGLAIIAVLVGTLTLEGDTLVDVSLRHRHVARLGWGRAFLATLERMVAVQHIALPPRLNGFFTPAMFATTVGLVLVAGWMVFRPVVARRPRPGAGLERARELVSRYGGGTLDYFALRADKEFYFWGDTVVAFAVYGGVCLVSPDPVGPPAQRDRAWRAFRHHVDSRSWSLAVIGAGEGWLPIYRASGMHDLYVGDEAVVRVENFALEGGRFKGLRQAVNRVARHGYSISFHDPAYVPASLASELQDVMTRSRRGGVERGFSMTLGRLFDPRDRGLLLAVVHAPEAEGGRPVAFCQYVPAPAINGFSLDLMRRDNAERPNGLMDFAIVETIKYLAARGYESLGLNFATMRAVLAGEAGDGLSQRAQAWLVRRMSGSMQIESLWRFNAKFDPEWQPRYAIYDSPEHALPAALAVARAESFWELPLIGRFLVPSGARQSASAGGG